MPKYIKKKNTHSIDPINEEYVQLLVKIKEILTKTAFHMLHSITLTLCLRYTEVDQTFGWAR